MKRFIKLTSTALTLLFTANLSIAQEYPDPQTCSPVVQNNTIGSGNFIREYDIDAGVEASLSRQCIQKCYLHNNCRLISYNFSQLSNSHACRIFDAGTTTVSSLWNSQSCPSNQ